MTSRSHTLQTFARLPKVFMTTLVVIGIALQSIIPRTTVTCSVAPVTTRTRNVTAADIFWKNLERGIDTIEQDTVNNGSSTTTTSSSSSDQEIMTNNTTAIPQEDSVNESEQGVTFSTSNGSSGGGGGGGSHLGRNTTNCECGLKRAGTGKIVGGSLAEDRVWPWLAGLIYIGDQKPKVFCGGSLINNLYILTAAHCVVDMQTVGFENFRIYLGTNVISGNSTNVTQVRINRKTLNSDVALIRLANFVFFNDRVQPVCLGQYGAPHIGKTAVVAGWGALSASTFPVNALRNVQVQVLQNTRCATNYAKVKIRITEFMLCANLPKKDSCKGDSGGPLFAKRNKHSVVHDQIGIVSFGQDCAKVDFPGVYTRVGRFIPWIKDNTRDATYCTLSFSKTNQ